MSRRGQVAAAILLLWAAGLALLVRREFFRPRTERLVEAGLRVAPGAAYYAVLQNGRQIGFASSTIDTAPGTISVADYLVADLPVGGRLHRASARTNVQLSRALRVRNFDFSLESEQGPLKATGLVQGDSAVLVAIQAGDTRPDT